MGHSHVWKKFLYRTGNCVGAGINQYQPEQQKVTVFPDCLLFVGPRSSPSSANRLMCVFCFVFFKFTHTFAFSATSSMLDPYPSSLFSCFPLSLNRSFKAHRYLLASAESLTGLPAHSYRCWAGEGLSYEPVWLPHVIWTQNKHFWGKLYVVFLCCQNPYIR